MNKNPLGQRVLATLASNARLFKPSKRHVRVQRIHAIDPRSTRMQFMRDIDPACDVLREHRRRQPVKGVIRLTQHVCLVLKLDEHANWPENLLLDNAHVGPRVREDRWLDPIAFCPMSLSSDVHRRALLFARINVTHDALQVLALSEFIDEVRRDRDGANVVLYLGDLRTLI